MRQKWYQDSVRQDELRLLLQEKELHDPLRCAYDPLPDATDKQARYPVPTLSVPAQSVPVPTLPVPAPSLFQPSDVQSTSSASRTTAWRLRQSELLPEKPRKVYSCSTCKKPISSPDHTQYRESRFCPDTHPGISKDS